MAKYPIGSYRPLSKKNEDAIAKIVERERLKNELRNKSDKISPQ